MQVGFRCAPQFSGLFRISSRSLDSRMVAGIEESEACCEGLVRRPSGYWIVGRFPPCLGLRKITSL